MKIISCGLSSGLSIVQSRCLALLNVLKYKYAEIQEGDTINLENLKSNCFQGFYKDCVELLGLDNTKVLHDHFAGQNVSFPMRLLSSEFVHTEIIRLYDGNNAETLARQFGYTYSWVMKVIKKHKLAGGKK